METIYVLTHLVMIICAVILCYSINLKNVEERSLKEAFNPRQLVTIIKTVIKNRQLEKKVRKALHSISSVSHFDIADANRFLRAEVKATVLKTNESINSERVNF